MPRPAIMPDISISISGTVSATLIQKRRVMSASSGEGSSPALTTRGSSVIPQIGQLPGSERTICGCIGQTYSVFETAWIGATGSSAMPHFGHDPGWSCRTSGCIGQVYDAASAAGPLALTFAGAASIFFFAKKLSGSLVNLSRQRGAAEIIGRALVLEESFAGGGIDPHSADGIDHLSTDLWRYFSQ